jgi:hypothetical protein
MQVSLESAVTWLDNLDDVPRYAQKPEGMTPLVNYDPVTGAVTDRGIAKQTSTGS